MTDILILGGGLAGAAGALWLADLGHRSTIVEARPRLGGRALSRDWLGDVVEYGGGWIRADHGLMIQLADRLGIRLTPRAKARARHHFPAAEPDLGPFLADANLIAEGSPEGQALRSMTLAEYLRHRALAPDTAREILSWWTISGSGDPDRIGVNELLTPKLAKGFDAKLDELAFTIEGGVSTLIEAAIKASGAQVILGDPVTKVSDAAKVTLTSGRILQGKAALLALPLNCLAQIRFTPPLPAPQAGLTHLGRALKLLIRAKGPLPGDLATGEAEGLRWLYADRVLKDGSTLIIGFGLADEVGPPDRPRIAKTLAAAFPGADLIAYDWHDWCADPFAQGTWVSPALASLPAYDPQHWQMRGALAFAGSDLYSAEQGWFEGALLTARAAVTALHESLTHENR